MTTTYQRGVLRSLPALIALLVALFVAPQAPGSTGERLSPGISSSTVLQAERAAAVIADAAEPVEPPAAEPASGSPAVADRTVALRAQRGTAATASRAPPATRA